VTALRTRGTHVHTEHHLKNTNDHDEDNNHENYNFHTSITDNVDYNS